MNRCRICGEPLTQTHHWWHCVNPQCPGFLHSIPARAGAPREWERIFQIPCPFNQGPLAISTSLSLPDAGRYGIEGWISNFGASNAHVFGGYLAVADCQQRLAVPASGGLSDMLMTLSGNEPVRVCPPDSTRGVTVFFEALNTSPQTEVVTIRVTKERE